MQCEKIPKRFSKGSQKLLQPVKVWEKILKPGCAWQMARRTPKSGTKGRRERKKGDKREGCPLLCWPAGLVVWKGKRVEGIANVAQVEKVFFVFFFSLVFPPRFASAGEGLREAV